MRRTCRVQINGNEFFAGHGELLLEAAVDNGFDIPVACDDGQCGACRMRLVEGVLRGGECAERGAVHACRSEIVSDVSVVFEELPPVTSVGGRVTSLTSLAPDVAEVMIEPSQPLSYLPGQCLQVQFRGYPTRCYSPTFPLQSDHDGGSLCLHIRCIPSGQVSSALGSEIGRGHRVQLTGPFGSAYLRSGLSNRRLVLVAGDTGFAPIWSIAEAALAEHPHRSVFIVAAARSLGSLYMVSALCRLVRFPNVTVIPVTDARQTVTPVVQAGPATDYMPRLTAHDIVHAAGAPQMVAAVARLAEAAGAVCFADPFVAQSQTEETWLSRTLTRLTRGQSGAAIKEQFLDLR